MKPSNNVCRLVFHTFFRQFYFVDTDVEPNPDTPDFWSKHAFESGMAVTAGMLGVRTASFTGIRCFFEVSPTEPSIPLSPWQRIVEGSIHLTNGNYAVQSATDLLSVHTGKCSPGDYRLRVYSAFLDQEVDRSFGDGYYDFHWLALWPAAAAGLKVIKSYDPGSGTVER